MAERKEIIQLQGPRPAALKITKDSHKIKKPPLPPPQRPIIIYTVSPKIIHTDPTQFKDLVQRLTGYEPSSQLPLDHMSMTSVPMRTSNNTTLHERGGAGGVERVGYFPTGILSPTPGSLPPISPNIFTPPPHGAGADLSPLTHFFQDLSPIAPNNFSSSLDFFQNFSDHHFH